MNLILLSVSALLTALSIQFKALHFLSYISLVPYYYFLKRYRNSGKKTSSFYKFGFLWSMIYYMAVYSFFCYMYPIEFLECTKTEAVFIIAFCWIGLSALQSVATALTAPLFALLSSKKIHGAFLFASLFTVFEWLQNFTWMGVPFLRLAISQVSFAPASQSASLFGSLFLSFFVALVNGFIGEGAYNFVHNKDYRKSSVCFLIAISSIVLNYGFGLVKIGIAESKDSKREKIKVAIIQGNVSSTDKWDESLLDGILEKYTGMTETAAKSGADIIVYPESAMNYYIKSAEGTEARSIIRNICKKYKVTAFIGAFDCGFGTDGEFKTYNANVAFYPDGTLEDFPYYKRHLVPFGEYVPMEKIISKLLPFLADLNVFEDQLTPGDFAAVVDTEYGKVGRLICFDSIYESLTLDSIRNGAELMIVSTNDAWYLNSPAAYIHNAHSQLRAVESGKYLVRAANTGISSIINENGVCLKTLGTLKDGILYGEVTFNSQRTFYSFIGDLYMIIPFAIITFCTVDLIIRKRKGKE